jgi:hypothetical protein
MTLGSHQKTVGDSQNWITPKWIIGPLGPFDLDPAGADPRPWDCANRTLTQNGLSVPWQGRCDALPWHADIDRCAGARRTPPDQCRLILRLARP